MIIDPTSVSFNSIKNDLITYIQSKPNASAWIDFYESSTGLTITELIAAFTTFLTFTTIANRRETYLPYVLNRSSALGIAGTLGYSAGRGTNVHLRLNITPAQTEILTKFSSIGTVNDVDIIVLENTTVNAGVPVDVDVVLGLKKEETIIIDTDDIKIFRFTSNNVSDDIRLFLNDDELTFGTIISDLLDDKYVLISNAVGAVDSYFLNISTDTDIRYTTGDSLKIEFIETNDLVFSNSDLILDSGTLISTTTLSAYQTPEVLNAIKVNAPLHHETIQVIRGREDYSKLFKGLDSGFADTNQRDITAAVIELTYVNEDLTLLTTSEKSALLITLLTYRPFGVQPPSDITDPLEVKYTLTFTVTLEIISTLSAVVTSDINDILDTFDKTLGLSLDLLELENQTEKLTANDNQYIKVARVTIKAPVYEAATAYDRGDYVTPTVDDGFYYECTTAGVGDSFEPAWPAVVGSTVSDGTVVWTCRDKTVNPSQLAWNEFYTFTLDLVLG